MCVSTTRRDVDSAWEQRKLEARKILDCEACRTQGRRAAVPSVRWCTDEDDVILYERNKGAIAKVYFEAASTQAEQSNGEETTQQCCLHCLSSPFQTLGCISPLFMPFAKGLWSVATDFHPKLARLPISSGKCTNGNGLRIV